MCVYILNTDRYVQILVTSVKTPGLKTEQQRSSRVTKLSHC
jgi:hypothetical protein